MVCVISWRDVDAMLKLGVFRQQCYGFLAIKLGFIVSQVSANTSHSVLKMRVCFLNL